MVIETYPAYEDGIPNSLCMTGHPEPISESGSPRLIKIRYITAISNEVTVSPSPPLDGLICGSA